MTTGESPSGSERVRKLRTILHAKAREEPDRRFHALADRVWRMDFLTEARLRSAATAGPPGRHSDTVGRQAWNGGSGNCRKTRGRHLQTQSGPAGSQPEEEARPVPAVGHTLHPGSGVADTDLACAWPICGADLQPEQYAHRPGRSATDAVKRVHRLVNTGHREVVDGDLSSHFGEIPHAGPMKSVARRVSDGRMPGLVKAWLEMPTEEDDGEGGKRRTNRARRERKGTPQGAPVPPCLGNLCMRRFILGWKLPGHARRLSSEIVNYADDFRLPGKAQAAEMLPAVRQIMERPRPRLNEGKTGCLRCPEEALEFPGYRVGRNHRPRGGDCIGTRPGKASVRGICRRASERTAAKHRWMTTEDMVGHLNRMLSGWANHWHLGQVSPAHPATAAHTGRRLRQWLCRKPG